MAAEAPGILSAYKIGKEREKVAPAQMAPLSGKAERFPESR